MGGPSTTRTPNSLTAPQPSLTGPGLGLLGNIFGGQGGGGMASPLQQRGGPNAGAFGAMNQPSPMGQQPQGGGLFGQFQNTFGSPLSPGVSNTLQQFASGPNPGLGVVGAYQPIFERNLALSQDVGPRFSSGNALRSTQAMNDYNMFAQQALLGGQQQQIGAALGLGGLQNQAQLPLMQQLLQTLFGGGGMGTPAVLNQQPGLGQQLLGLGGMGLGALLGGPAGAGIGSQLGGLFGGGGGLGAGLPTDQQIFNNVPSNFGGGGGFNPFAPRSS